MQSNVFIGIYKVNVSGARRLRKVNNYLICADPCRQVLRGKFDSNTHIASLGHEESECEYVPSRKLSPEREETLGRGGVCDIKEAVP